MACLFWGFFLVIVFAFMCCIMPWWLVLLIFCSTFIYTFFFSFNSVFKVRDTKQHKPNKKVKKAKNQNKADDVNIGAGTLLAGAALAHQMRKQHKHNDTKDITDERLNVIDDELDNIYDYDAIADNDYEMRDYEEEQAAYDDADDSDFWDD